MIRTSIVKKTHPPALPAQAPGGRGSVLRRMGAVGDQAHRRHRVGAARTPAAHARHLSPTAWHRAVLRLLRRAHRLPRWTVSQTKAPARALRRLPAPAALLSGQETVRDPR